jgi:hypothetical protein
MPPGRYRALAPSTWAALMQELENAVRHARTDPRPAGSWIS